MVTHINHKLKNFKFHSGILSSNESAIQNQPHFYPPKPKITQTQYLSIQKRRNNAKTEAQQRLSSLTLKSSPKEK
jgi:hypothetical protein